MHTEPKEISRAEAIGRSIRENSQLLDIPEKLVAFLVKRHNLLRVDACQIVLKLLNPIPVAARPSLRQIELVVTERCNLACDYCFVQRKSRQVMTEATARQAVDLLIRASAEINELDVVFFGGEPLLAFDLIMATVLYGNERAASHKKCLRWSMTTNGTLFNDTILSFCHEHGVRFLMSIDGDRATHDAHRRWKGTGSAYACIERNISLIKKHQPWLGARMTVTPDTADLLFANFSHLVGMGFNQFIIESVEGMHWPSEACRQYIDGMVKVFEYYREVKQEKKLRITAFDTLVDSPDENVVYRGCWAGRSSLAVAADGVLYPCSKFISSSPEYGSVVMGHVGDDPSGDGYRYLSKAAFFPGKCLECDFLFRCNGGCPASNFAVSGDMMRPCENECAIAKMRALMRETIKKRCLHLDSRHQRHFAS